MYDFRNSSSSDRNDETLGPLSVSVSVCLSVSFTLCRTQHTFLVLYFSTPTQTLLLLILLAHVLARSTLLLPAAATALFSALSLFLSLSLSLSLSVNTIIHEPPHSAWWNIARTCNLTTYRRVLNIKVIRQTSRSHGFCVCMIGLLHKPSWPGFTKCAQARPAGCT